MQRKEIIFERTDQHRSPYAGPGHLQHAIKQVRTFSMPFFWKRVWSSLKFSMNSHSSLASNLTLDTGMAPAL
jgi:hypothetical protein